MQFLALLLIHLPEHSFGIFGDGGLVSNQSGGAHASGDNFCLVAGIPGKEIL